MREPPFFLRRVCVSLDSFRRLSSSPRRRRRCQQGELARSLHPVNRSLSDHPPKKQAEDFIYVYLFVKY